MRNAVFTLSTILFLLGCADEDISDRKKRNDKWVWTTSLDGSDGTWVPIGSSTTIRNFRFTRFFQSNGKVHSSGIWKELDIPDTTKRFNENGDLIVTFVNTIGSDTSIYHINGRHKLKTTDGKLEWEFEVRNLQLAERSTRNYYYGSGSLKEQQNIFGDSVHVTEFRQNQTIKCTLEYQDKKPLQITYWRDDGSIREFQKYREDTNYRTIEIYDTDNTLLRRFTERNRERNGRYFDFYDSGQIYREFTLVDNILQGPGKVYYQAEI